jgi:phosphoribosylglycinamide formyltransferase 1
LQAILDACANGALPAQVVAVVSNKPDAFGLQRASNAGVPAIALPFNKAVHLDRAGYDRELGDVIDQHAPDLIVCAGWLRILGAGFVRRFAGKIIRHCPARSLACTPLPMRSRRFSAARSRKPA